MTSLPLSHCRILFFVDHIYEDLELWYPKLRLEEAGAEVVIAGPKGGEVYAGKHGYPCRSDCSFADVEADQFHGMVLPGGFMPDKLRRDPLVLQLIQNLSQRQRMIAAICHGGWLAISAKVYRGVQVTGSLGIKDDLENAGAIWLDQPVVIDRHFISSRRPDDLPAFGKAIIDWLEQDRQS